MMHALCFLVFLAAINGIQAVEYSVTNSALSTRFRDQIGTQYATQKLDSATQFIWNIFQQNNPADRRHVQKVGLLIENFDNPIAYTNTNTEEIHVSGSYVNSYKGDVRNEITGVLYHEMTHVWQWFGRYGVPRVPVGLTEGIADYVRLKANYIPSHWVKPGEGQKWDQGYDVTARFLDYCDGLRSGFVAELNKMIRNGYSDQLFLQLLGKTVDQLWTDYKAKYGNIA
ncbi:uncharacterized protein [Cicer arietinum]|uniref:Uncharacterized protein LOC101505538 n=1 Tax=Cicer arietinum TaxID=3827 RepID=A0A1S2XZD0_CICAR|nr:uncharacterized protein LOC101505538 [Cicer arietinum]